MSDITAFTDIFVRCRYGDATSELCVIKGFIHVFHKVRMKNNINKGIIL